MNLFEKVVAHVKSFGHEVEGEAHKLLNEFVEYLRNNEAAIAKFLVGKTAEEAEVVKNFVQSVAPASEKSADTTSQVADTVSASVPAAPVLPELTTPAAEPTPTQG